MGGGLQYEMPGYVRWESENRPILKDTLSKKKKKKSVPIMKGSHFIPILGLAIDN